MSSACNCEVREDDSLSEWSNGRAEDGTPKGPVCLICSKLHHADPSYTSKSVDTLEVEFKDPEKFELCFA